MGKASPEWPMIESQYSDRRRQIFNQNRAAPD
jgi:hypothetical protein